MLEQKLEEKKATLSALADKRAIEEAEEAELSESEEILHRGFIHIPAESGHIDPVDDARGLSSELTTEFDSPGLSPRGQEGQFGVLIVTSRSQFRGADGA